MTDIPSQDPRLSEALKEFASLEKQTENSGLFNSYVDAMEEICETLGVDVTWWRLSCVRGNAIHCNLLPLQNL